MPIEIKELHIRISVNGSQSDQTIGVRAASTGGIMMDDRNAKDTMVAECVEQVLQIIQNKAER